MSIRLFCVRRVTRRLSCLALVMLALGCNKKVSDGEVTTHGSSVGADSGTGHPVGDGDGDTGSPGDGDGDGDGDAHPIGDGDTSGNPDAATKDASTGWPTDDAGSGDGDAWPSSDGGVVDPGHDAGTLPGDCRAGVANSPQQFNTLNGVCFSLSQQPPTAWECYRTDGRTIKVNGASVTCGKLPFPGSAPYVVEFSAGTDSTAAWAYW
jgi:hypothetical protein